MAAPSWCVQKSQVRASNSPSGFTLVECLVVIGIIAVLIAILLPALSKARDTANTVRCSANLHIISEGIATYVVEFKGLLPPSNEWRIPSTGLMPSAPFYGYIHWSSYLYSRKDISNQIGIYQSPKGWEAFQCPSLPEGGLPPTNTYAGNSSVANEADPSVLDAQAPRLAYTVNEALCPRGFYVLGATVASAQVQRPYRFVRAGSVQHSSSTILATELWGLPSLMEDDSMVQPGLGNYVVVSHRPVSGFTSSIGPKNLWQLNNPPAYAWLFPINRVGVTSLTPDPSTTSGVGGAVTSTLDWVGRNHGRRRLDASGFDLRTTNFLYLDGHVETKNIRQTLPTSPPTGWSPAFQWGDQFYSLTGGENVQ